MSTPEHKLFYTAIMHSWNAVVITSADPATGYAVQIANPAFCKQTGYAMEELQGRSLRMLQGPETDPAVIERLRASLKEASYFEGTTFNYRKDGSVYLVRWNISPVRDEDGTLTHFVSVQQDISAQHQSELKNMLLGRALDASSDPILLTDIQAKIIFVNHAFTKITGYSVEELIGKTPALLHSGKHDPGFYAALHKALDNGHAFRATFINRRHDGSLYHVEQSISPILDEHGRVTHYVSVSKDITERVRREERLQDAASHDKLTRLYNRHHGETALEEAIARSSAEGKPLSLIICDIDHFKKINDRFGHPGGDRVLKETAAIIAHTVRASDVVIRWGGEEFLIVLEDCAEGPAIELAERVRQRVETFLHVDIGAVTLSLGLATRLADESSAELIARADRALYQAKASGRNRLVTAPGA